MRTFAWAARFEPARLAPQLMQMTAAAAEAERAGDTEGAARTRSMARELGALGIEASELARGLGVVPRADDAEGGPTLAGLRAAVSAAPAAAASALRGLRALVAGGATAGDVE
jgi:hypothetical protein